LKSPALYAHTAVPIAARMSTATGPNLSGNPAHFTICVSAVTNAETAMIASPFMLRQV
jgi:hypothetical protein